MPFLQPLKVYLSIKKSCPSNIILTAREMEIAGYLKDKQSLKKMEEKTGLSKKILKAHIRNMMKKLKAHDPDKITQMFRWKIH